VKQKAGIERVHDKNQKAMFHYSSIVAMRDAGRRGTDYILYVTTTLNQRSNWSFYSLFADEWPPSRQTVSPLFVWA